MIREISANDAVCDLINQLTDVGIVAGPKTDTPLAELCKASYPDGLEGEVVYYENGLPKTREAFVGPRDVIEASIVPEVDGTSTHDHLIETYSQLAARSIQDSFLLARTVVNPIIREALVAIHERIDETIQSNVNRISVLPVEAPEALLSPALADLVARYSDTAFEEVTVQHVFPDMNVEQTIDAAMTGSKSYDGPLRALLEGTSPEIIRSVFQGVFSANIEPDKEAQADKLEIVTSGNISPSNLSYFVRYPDTDYPNAKTAALLSFLLAKKFMNDVPEGVNMGLSDYKAYVSSIMEQSGRVLAIYLRKQADQFKRQTLVLDYPRRRPEAIYASDNASIKVDKHIYNEWLSQGGSPEIILGAYVVGDLKDIDKGTPLLENAQRYKDAWSRFYGLLKTEQMSKIFNTTVAAVRDVVSSMIATSDEKLGLNRAEAQQRLATIVEGLAVYDTKNIHALVRDVICATMFPRKDVKKILALVDFYAESNPNAPVVEAAYWSMMDLVVDWVGSMIQTESMANV